MCFSNIHQCVQYFNSSRKNLTISFGSRVHWLPNGIFISLWWLYLRHPYIILLTGKPVGGLYSIHSYYLILILTISIIMVFWTPGFLHNIQYLNNFCRGLKVLASNFSYKWEIVVNTSIARGRNVLVMICPFI
jgi:hypothetical protein